MKVIKKFQLKIVIFTTVIHRCMLDGRVFIMMISYIGPMLVITINDIELAMEALVKKGTDFSNKFRTTSSE